MYVFTIVVFITSISIATGLKCVTTSEDLQSVSNEECFNSKYCFALRAQIKILEICADVTKRGCPKNNIVNGGFKTCDENGVGTQTKLHAALYCCDTDLCNSVAINSSTINCAPPNPPPPNPTQAAAPYFATTYSLMGIHVSAIFVKFVFHS